MNELKQLESKQLEAFNVEYVNGNLWDEVLCFIDSNFKNGEFVFLDIGGGNGVFTDKILDHYPNSQAILLDNAQNLIEINKQNPRKKIIEDSVENLEIYLNTNKIDLVFINWVLHHLVSDTYRKTRSNIENILRTIKRNENVKFVAIFENMYNGFLFDNLPGKMIYQITSLKSVKALVRRMGANTAGVGVSFLSQKAWMNSFSNIFGTGNFRKIDFERWDTPFARKVFLHIKNIHISLFWIKNN